jgi:cytochrome c
MKAVLLSAIVAAGVLSVGVAKAQTVPEVAKTQCGKCHELDKKKKGPSFQESAKKYKGKADAEATMFKFVTDTKGDHPEIKASPDEIKTVLKWILTL